MPYFSSKKVCYLSISTHPMRVPIATTCIWDIGVGLSRRGQKKMNPNRLKRKSRTRECFFFSTLICLWRTPAAMRQFAAPLWLDIDTTICAITLSFSGWFHDPRNTPLDLAQRQTSRRPISHQMAFWHGSTCGHYGGDWRRDTPNWIGSFNGGMASLDRNLAAIKCG